MTRERLPLALLCLALLIIPVQLFGQETVNIGFNYPQTGPYSVQGLDQLRAAQMAVQEINEAGGILGRKIDLFRRNSESKPDVTIRNVAELITRDKVKMVFGGSSSAVAIAAAKVCYRKNIPFFGTLTYSTSTTGEQGLPTTFRECYDSHMAAEALGKYLRDNFPDKKYCYITANYTWGWTTEKSVREVTATEDKQIHKSMTTPFPGATEEDFRQALDFAKAEKPDVLVLVLFGKDMVTAIKLAYDMGLKDKMQIVVPNLTLGMAEGGGPEAMEGVIGCLPWCWEAVYKYDYPEGREFVDKYESKYGRYPGTSASSAYMILYQYKEAVERAGTFDTDAVIGELEGHEYQLLKDKQYWRKFDHQSIQTVYLVKCKPAEEVKKDKYQLDYFEILSTIDGETAAVTFDEWSANRRAFGKLPEL